MDIRFLLHNSFLTKARQNFARKHVVAIDGTDFEFHMISDETKIDLIKSPEDGFYIYGLSLEELIWDDKKEALEESPPKVLFFQMRTIHLLQNKLVEIDICHFYRCPVYKTTRWASKLSTIGHSKNFVMSIMILIQKKT